MVLWSCPHLASNSPLESAKVHHDASDVRSAGVLVGADEPGELGGGGVRESFESLADSVINSVGIYTSCPRDGVVGEAVSGFVVFVASVDDLLQFGCHPGPQAGGENVFWAVSAMGLAAAQT